VNESSQDSVVTGVAISTFFPEGGNPVVKTDERQFTTSLKWQKLGELTNIAEVRGVLAGMPQGYMAETLGRAAAAGEQFGLALTAVRDAEVWRDMVPADGQENRRVMAARGLAEASGLWSVSSGHAVVNVVARVVRIHTLSVSMDAKLRWSGPPEPFASARNSNLSLNVSTVNAIAAAAAATGESDLKAIVNPLTTLLRSAAWEALTLQRDVGYHRWRPQSVEGGAPTSNPWSEEDGGYSMLFGMSGGHVPPLVRDVVAESRDGHDSLAIAMSDVFDALPKAMISAGVGMWA
jgi:hypothetical protein